MKIHRITAAAVSTLLLAAGAQAAGPRDTPMARVAQEQIATYAISPDAGRPEAAAWSSRLPSADAASRPHSRHGERLGAAGEQNLPATLIYSPDSGRPEAAGAHAQVQRIEDERLAAAQADVRATPGAAAGDGLVLADVAAAADEAWMDGAGEDDTLAYEVLTDEPLTDEEVAYISESLKPDAVIVLDGQQYHVYWEQSPEQGAVQ
ncbi:hypothetical protein [Aquabacterium sp. J223]|uniref:hypothetical protein n=1 Tax=Aquabacterium sp. J223 TaxID=2898431 RepID=UPI0021AE2059|nr:hypothetical protein [Aquabacterium sp. J223]UUX94755.1 hypothetical protein LRS07_15920 [Aquabacterium sp. J223]